MGKCVFCGRSAGLFSTRHEACERRHDSGWAAMIGECRLAFQGKTDCRTLRLQLSETAGASHITLDRMQDAMIEGWGLAVDGQLNNGGLDEQDEHRLVALGRRFGLSPELLDRSGAWTRMVKAAVIRDLLGGIVPDRVAAGADLPFALTADERPIWLFNDVKYREDPMHPTGGGYRGARVEIAKGQYYRPDGFSSMSAAMTDSGHTDSGALMVTTRHIGFAGLERRLRLRHDQFVSFGPYSDGVAIQRDVDTARLDVFVTGDGWFTYNLLANIGNVSGW